MKVFIFFFSILLLSCQKGHEKANILITPNINYYAKYDYMEFWKRRNVTFANGKIYPKDYYKDSESENFISIYKRNWEDEYRMNPTERANYFLHIYDYLEAKKIKNLETLKTENIEHYRNTFYQKVNDSTSVLDIWDDFFLVKDSIIVSISLQSWNEDKTKINDYNKMIKAFEAKYK